MRFETVFLKPLLLLTCIGIYSSEYSSYSGILKLGFYLSYNFKLSLYKAQPVYNFLQPNLYIISSIIIALTLNSPVVIVPVLSKHTYSVITISPIDTEFNYS